MNGGGLRLQAGPSTTKSPMNHRPLVAALIAALAAAALVACSPAPTPISTSTSDPSNPHAPEGVVHVASSSSNVLGLVADPHAGHGHASAPATTPDAGVVYVCPMHPEVTATEPNATCPKCNMKLVPKK